MSKRQLARKTFVWAVIGVVLVLFARTLHQNWENLQDLDLRPDVLIVGALVAFVVSVVMSGIAWGRIVSYLTGTNVPAREAVRIHLASWLLKYVPGQAGSFLNKIAWAKKRNLDGKKVTASFIYENIFLLLASTALTLPVLLAAVGDKIGEDVGLFMPLIVMIPFVVVVMIPQFFAAILNLLFKLLKKQRLHKSELLTTKQNIQSLFEFMIPRIINGAAFVLVAISVFGIPPSQYIVFGAIYVMAGIIGMLAIFVPSGLGVREAVITLLASAYIPTEQAIALALIARFYATVADGLIALLYIYTNKGAEKV